MHRMSYLYRSFSTQKSPIISGSFAENVLQLKASYESLLPCTSHLVNTIEETPIEETPSLNDTGES